jgi:hypothetical protein
MKGTLNLGILEVASADLAMAAQMAFEFLVVSQVEKGCPE